LFFIQFERERGGEWDILLKLKLNWRSLKKKHPNREHVGNRLYSLTPQISLKKKWFEECVRVLEIL
jgi:hypothetical protein